MSQLPEVPIGTIIAWITRVEGVDDTVNLPDGWVRCDGSTIPHPSIWAGKITPDLNNARRFLRGGTDADQLKLEEDQLQDHIHGVTDPGHSHPYIDKYVWLSEDIYGHQGPDGTDAKGNRWDYPDQCTTSSETTGISVTGVTSSYRRGDETRPKNMNVIYIMRVW